MGSSRALRKLAFVAALPFAVGACGPGSAATASPTTAATTVKVTLQEWAVATDAASAPAGAFTFAVTNMGPDDTHEFVVIKTDLSLIALPTDATGAVDEAGGGMEVMGEIEDVTVGANRELKVTLGAAAYVLICNIYDEAEKEAHYQEGMRTSFTVTQ
jgi:uncharacterized cupredoxin-like copper-binding protein